MEHPQKSKERGSAAGGEGDGRQADTVAGGELGRVCKGGDRGEPGEEEADEGVEMEEAGKEEEGDVDMVGESSGAAGGSASAISGGLGSSACSGDAVGADACFQRTGSLCSSSASALASLLAAVTYAEEDEFRRLASAGVPPSKSTPTTLLAAV
jgi:hypothetical protein